MLTVTILIDQPSTTWRRRPPRGTLFTPSDSAKSNYHNMHYRSLHNDTRFEDYLKLSDLFPTPSGYRAQATKAGKNKHSTTELAGQNTGNCTRSAELIVITRSPDKITEDTAITATNTTNYLNFRAAPLNTNTNLNFRAPLLNMLNANVYLKSYCILIYQYIRLYYSTTIITILRYYITQNLTKSSNFTHSHRLSAQDLFCSLYSKICVNEGKSQGLGRSVAAVSPPGGLARTIAPPSWVTDEKNSTSYSSTPLTSISGSVSCCYTRHVSQNIHDPSYTLCESCRKSALNALDNTLRHGSEIAYLSYILQNSINVELLKLIFFFPLVAAVIGNEEKDKNSANNSTKESTSAGRNSSISGRRPLRPRSAINNSNSSSNGDGGDDEDEGFRREKLKTQCENDAVAPCRTSTELMKEGIDENDDSLKEDLTNDLHDKRDQWTPLPLPVNSTYINQGSVNFINIRDMSIVRGFSRVWDIARNVSGFNATQVNTTVNLNISVGNTIEDISYLSDISQETEYDDDDKSEPAGSPSPSPLYLTPTSKVPTSRGTPPRKHVELDYISPVRTNFKSRSRSKSESSYRRDPYHKPTPTALLKRRLKEKIALERSAAFNETPVARMRHNSEPATTTISSNDSHNLSFSQGGVGCTRIRESGTHDCGTDGAGIHLENDLLNMNNPFRLNMSNISKAVERALSTDLMEIDNSNPTVTITFCREEVDRVTRISSPDEHPRDLIEQKSLLYLLGQINRHMSRTTSCNQNFNGLKITSMSDRAKRMKLDDDNCYPLGILHIGRSRGLDLLPKRAARLSLNVYDVEMRNWSFLTISSKTRATMIPSFAPERKFEMHIPDYHIVIIPCNSDEGCNLSRSCQNCVVAEDGKIHDASDDQGKETTCRQEERMAEDSKKCVIAENSKSVTTEDEEKKTDSEPFHEKKLSVPDHVDSDSEYDSCDQEPEDSGTEQVGIMNHSETDSISENDG